MVSNRVLLILLQRTCEGMLCCSLLAAMCIETSTSSSIATCSLLQMDA